MRKQQTRIPLICHNFKGYDSHLILKDLKYDERLTKLEGLPYNSEKLRTMTINSFTLIDSFAFLSSSLDKLVTSLRASDHQFPILSKVNTFSDPDVKRLMLRKGVMPFEFMDSIETLERKKELPPKDAFYSRLTKLHISEEDYQHANRVFEVLQCKNMLEYMEHYCRLDVYLLAEVFLQFRSDTYADFGLDCCHYISLPQLAFDCMLKLTGVEIEMMTDMDMILFFEQNLRGGLSFIAQRYCERMESSEHDWNLLYIDGDYFVELILFGFDSKIHSCFQPMLCIQMLRRVICQCAISDGSPMRSC